MNESDIYRIVRQILREEIAPILMGKVVSTESSSRVTVRRITSEWPISNVRNIQPYGVSSRPPENMTTVVVPVGSDPTHLNMIGQFDEARPEVEEGEVCFYGPKGQMIWFTNDGSIRSGIKTAVSPAVLGDILETLLENVLKAFLDAPAIGTCAVGPVVLDPAIRAKLSEELRVRVKEASTNFLAQKQFVDRGGKENGA